MILVNSISEYFIQYRDMAQLHPNCHYTNVSDIQFSEFFLTGSRKRSLIPSGL